MRSSGEKRDPARSRLWRGQSEEVEEVEKVEEVEEVKVPTVAEVGK
jgi:hypothetical protein